MYRLKLYQGPERFNTALVCPSCKGGLLIAKFQAQLNLSELYVCPEGCGCFILDKKIVNNYTRRII